MYGINSIEDEVYAFVALSLIFASAGSILYAFHYCITRCQRSII